MLLQANFAPFLKPNFIILKQIILSCIDLKWSDHITNLNDLKRSTELRGAAQEKPLDEYRKESLKRFSIILSEMEESMFNTILNSMMYFKKDFSDMSYQEFHAYSYNKFKHTYFGLTPFLNSQF